MALVLYVEDYPPAQMLMAAIVADLTPHALITAKSGREAESLAATFRPDLYIVDLDLPDTQGTALIRTLRGLHKAPALLVSAYEEAVDREGLSADITAYLHKPLDPAHVAHMIDQALMHTPPPFPGR